MCIPGTTGLSVRPLFPLSSEVEAANKNINFSLSRLVLKPKQSLQVFPNTAVRRNLRQLPALFGFLSARRQLRSVLESAGDTGEPAEDNEQQQQQQQIAADVFRTHTPAQIGCCNIFSHTYPGLLTCTTRWDN